MKKTNSKVGAEPRIKRKFNRSEGLHVGVHRDEWGLFDSRSNPYCLLMVISLLMENGLFVIILL